MHGPSPTTAPGVRTHDLLTVSLAGAGTIDHVVNDTGGPVTPTYLGPSTVVTYPRVEGSRGGPDGRAETGT